MIVFSLKISRIFTDDSIFIECSKFFQKMLKYNYHLYPVCESHTHHTHTHTNTCVHTAVAERLVYETAIRCAGCIRLSSSTAKPQGGAEHFWRGVLLSNLCSFFTRIARTRVERVFGKGRRVHHVAIHRNIISPFSLCERDSRSLEVAARRTLFFVPSPFPRGHRRRRVGN